MSLKDRIEYLERDLKSSPIRIAAYSDFPFAIFRYSPLEEWNIRREIRLLKTRVESVNKRVFLWSIADFIWESLDTAEAFHDIVELENDRDFLHAQEQVTTYLTDEDFYPIDEIMRKKYERLDPERDIVFLWRLGSLSPNMLRTSGLIERLHSQKVNLVPTILFYPGDWKGGLNFMNLRHDYEPIGSYRVKIYGRDTN